MNKRLLIIAGALSAFALVFLGSVFAKMQERSVAENNPVPQLPAPQLDAPLVTPSENGALLASASSVLPPAQTTNTATTQNPSAAPSTRLSSAQAQQESVFSRQDECSGNDAALARRDERTGAGIS